MNDLISRQAAIDSLGDEPEVWSGKDEYEQGLNNQWHYDVNALKAVPSAERHGRWVPITKDGIDPAEFLCSVCGRKISHSGVKDMVSIHYPYCHCGAKMDEVTE